MYSSDVPDAVSFVRVGHIDEFIRIAVAGGIDPLDAVRMGTINPARYYRVDHMIGSLAPGRQADILLVDTLEQFSVQGVIARGKQVVVDGEWTGGLERPVYPEFLRHTVKLSRHLDAADLVVHAPPGAETVMARVIGAESLLSDERHIALAVVDGAVPADAAWTCSRS